MEHLFAGFIGESTGHSNAFANASEFIIIPFILENMNILFEKNILPGRIHNFAIPPKKKKRSNERAGFKNRSSERVHFKGRSTAMYKDSS